MCLSVQTPSLLVFLGPLPVIWLALLGLVIGSFLNVVIARVPNEQSIVRPGSRCPKCGHALAWYENIPVLSYLALRGRCRSCRASISARYPLIEILTAFLFLACQRRFGWEYTLAPALMLVTLLIPLTFIDAEHWILPHAIIVPGIALGILMAIPLGLERVVTMALGAAAAFLVYRAMEFFGWVAFRKEALGAGDKFLAALIGAFLGYQALFALIFLSALQGSLFGGARLLLTGRAGPAGGSEGGSPVQSI
ncbi:MAG: prepilin peptidase, partial [Myxococcaceae bacterium]